jgi:DNA repair exonuclease SbcCD nuclease subunit
MTDIRIAHFSDIHLGLAPNWSTINLNRFFSWGRWVVSRRRDHSIDRLNRAIEVLIRLRPDLVICTGDFGQTGLSYEFDAVSKKFEYLTRNEIPMLLTGGNHDYYNRSASDEVARLQEKHGLGLKIDDDGVCQLNDLTILLLHQGIYNPFYMAKGKLESKVLDAVERRQQSGQLSAIHLAAGHFPICDVSGEPISSRKRLDGDTCLKQFLQTQQVPAYLCGHRHKPFTISLADGCIQYCSGSITDAGVLRVLTYRAGQLVEETTPNIDSGKEMAI